MLTDLWAAVNIGLGGQYGAATMFLRDYNPAGAGSHDEIGHASIFSPDWPTWPTPSTPAFVEMMGQIPGISYTIPAGHELELKLVGENGSQAVVFAYDTADYSSLVNLSYVPPVAATTFYLHNNPTPPVGDTPRPTAALLMDTTAPTATTLFDYDGDGEPGLAIEPTDLGLGETNRARFQEWRTGALASDLTITDDVVIDIWGAPGEFEGEEVYMFNVFLRDFDPGTSIYVELGSAGYHKGDWDAGWNSFQKKTIMIPNPNHTVLAGHQLEVKVIVQLGSNREIMFAYDTTTYPSAVKVP